MIKQAEQSFSFYHFGQLLFQNRKKAGLYGLFFVVVSFNLCLFLQANLQTPAAERIINAIQLMCFAAMGIFNVWFFYKRNFLAELSLSGAKLAFICLLFIVIALVLFVYYYVSGNNELVMAFASSGAFLLPFLIYQGWIEFMDIPVKSYPVWYLPAVDAAVRNTAVSAANSMQVQLKIARRADDMEQHTFPVTTPGKLRLGRMFERFIEDQSEQGSRAVIATTDGRDPFGWHFYEEKWGGFYNRNLNPTKSLLENNIKTNAKIMVVRISAAG
ncbi:MAG: TssN family type VI secretion system protein [Chitinophagaceae bacterium]